MEKERNAAQELQMFTRRDPHGPFELQEHVRPRQTKRHRFPTGEESPSEVPLFGTFTPNTGFCLLDSPMSFFWTSRGSPGGVDADGDVLSVWLLWPF